MGTRGREQDAAADGKTVDLEIKSTSLVTADSAPWQRRRWSRSSPEDVVGVIVVERITAEARDDLDRTG